MHAAGRPGPSRCGATVGVVAALSFLVQMPAAAERYAPPSRWLLGPLYGTGCPTWGACSNPEAATSPSTAMESEVRYDLGELALNDIPVVGYHFDGNAWSRGECDWALGDVVLSRLRLA